MDERVEAFVRDALKISGTRNEIVEGVGTPACIRYRYGKAARCEGSSGKPQHHLMSSSPSVARPSPQPVISAWWPGPAWPRN
jgi:hypothetical protein